MSVRKQMVAELEFVEVHKSAARNRDDPATSTKSHFATQISTYALRNFINIECANSGS
jgi:hypothetical protein